MVEQYYQDIQNYYKTEEPITITVNSPIIPATPNNTPTNIQEKNTSKENIFKKDASKEDDTSDKLLDEILSRPWTKIPKVNKEILIQQYIQKVSKYAKKNNSKWKTEYDEYIYSFVNKIVKDDIKKLKIEYADKKVKKISNLVIDLDFSGTNLKELIKIE